MICENCGKGRGIRRMKAWTKKGIKIVAAVVVGLALLDLFCFWYYNPAGYLQDESRATDVIREPGLFTSRANEGFSWAVIDENGYNNRQVTGEDGVFVLMMGSSHTEGLYVLPGDDVSSQLGVRLRESGVDGIVYNIGTSAHHLARNISNLERALTRFEPSGYVVIEAASVIMGRQTAYAALDGSLKRFGATEVVISEWISERPLLRTVYRQLQDLRGMGSEEGDDESAPAEASQEMLDEYMDVMTRLFQMVRDAADAHGVTPIVYYHPHLLLQEDGTAEPDTYQPFLEIYRGASEAAGVRFMDMTDVFLETYKEEHILPHGFINTAAGTGHLNAAGNRVIAETLCAEILEQEAAK